MKVWYLVDSLRPGGTERSTLDLASAMSELATQVKVLTLKRPESGEVLLPVPIGLSVERIPGDRTFQRVHALRQLLRVEQPDILHTALYASDQTGRLAAFRTKTAVVSSLVSMPYNATRPPGVAAAAKRLPYALVDHLTAQIGVSAFHAVTEGVLKAWSSHYRSVRARGIVVERGRSLGLFSALSPEERESARRAIGLTDRDKVILALGRQEPIKDYPTLLEAHRRILDTVPQAKLVLAGRNGTATPELRRIIDSDHLLVDSVLMLGHREDVPRLLAAADVVASTSVTEGAAGALVEAMAARVPIVCTSVEGLAGVIVDGKNALTVPRRQPAAVADAISWLLLDESWAATLASSAHATFCERFELTRSVARMHDLYKRTTGLGSLQP